MTVDMVMVTAGMAHTMMERSNLTKMVGVAKPDAKVMGVVELVGAVMVMLALKATKSVDVITEAEKLLRQVENATMSMCMARGESESRIMAKFVLNDR